MTKKHPSPTFSIVILTWNGKKLLQQYLPSILSTKHHSFEILVADNHSNDDTDIWLQETYPNIKHIKYDTNMGYASGNNASIDHVKGTYTIFLNNDVAVDKNWLNELEKTYTKLPDASILQPKILNERKRNYFEYAGANGGFIDYYGYPYCRGRIFDTVEQDHHQYDEETCIHWASGAAFVIKTDVFKRLKGFDAMFRFHMEEIDLCWRAWNMGYKCYSSPKSQVYHVGGSSLSTASMLKTYYNYRNNLWMLWKNLPKKKFIRRMTIRIFLDIIASIRAFCTFHYKEWIAIKGAYIIFLRHLPHFQRKRKQLKKMFTSSLPLKYHDTSIIWQYFVRKKKTFQSLL